MKTIAFLVNEITDGMIPVKADMEVKNGYIRVSMKEQRLTICVSKKDIEGLSNDSENIPAADICD